MSGELYPQGAASLDKHDALLYRHAQKLVTCIQQDMAINERHNLLAANVERTETKFEAWRERIDREMTEQTAKLNQILLALKVLGGIATPALAAGLVALVSYMLRR